MKRDSRSQLPATYDSARAELAETRRIDDCKLWADKAKGLAEYARLAGDLDLLHEAMRVQAVAVRRAGELLREVELGTGSHWESKRAGTGPLTRKSAADEAGLSGRQRKAAIAIAGMEAREFDRLIEAVPPPSVDALTALVRLPEDEQAPIRTAIKSGKAKQAKQDIKRGRRRKREKDLGEKTRAAAAKLGTKTYNVIVIDPPWQFESYSVETGMDRAADNHYPTMTMAELAALKLPADKNCVLFHWTTAPMLEQALNLTSIWGFSYRTHCVWLKTKNGKPWIGTGFWLRNRHEILLIATRGDIPAPAPGDQWLSVIEADIGAHSEKPQHFMELIEEIYPTAVRVEMFARRPRPGWDGWGNEA